MPTIKRPPKKGKTICFDFDGVLAEYKGWQGPEHCGEPIPGMLDLIRKLEWYGYRCVCSTARSDTRPVERWMVTTGIGLAVTNTKPIAEVYIDDRGLRFESVAATAESLAALLMEPGLME